jgi:hypothetical protein
MMLVIYSKLSVSMSSYVIPHKFLIPQSVIVLTESRNHSVILIFLNRLNGGISARRHRSEVNLCRRLLSWNVVQIVLQKRSLFLIPYDSEARGRSSSTVLPTTESEMRNISRHFADAESGCRQLAIVPVTSGNHYCAWPGKLNLRLRPVEALQSPESYKWF